MFFVPIPKDIAKERGLKTYFIDKVCNLGLIAPRTVSKSACTCFNHRKANNDRSIRWAKKNPERSAENSSTWKRNNPEKVKAINKKAKLKKLEIDPNYFKDLKRKWDKANPDRKREHDLKYRIANRDLLNTRRRSVRSVNKDLFRARNRLWSKLNPDKVKIMRDRWKSQNPNRVKEIAHDWYLNNKHKVYAYSSKRRSLKILSTITLSSDLSTFVLEEAFDLSRLREKVTNFKWHVDHMIPLQAENTCGLHVWNNFQCLPESMNASKQNKLIYTNPHEWLYDIPKFFKVVYQKEIAA